MKQIWDSLTAGKKRFHCHSVDTAKTETTRTKRIEAILQDMKLGK